MPTDGYVVAVKPSARKRSAAAGEWVADHGPRRAFDSKADARAWAESISASAPGGRVWVQDANDWDEDDVDGYLVGGERVPGRREAAGSQAGLDAFSRS